MANKAGARWPVSDWPPFSQSPDSGVHSGIIPVKPSPFGCNCPPLLLEVSWTCLGHPAYIATIYYGYQGDGLVSASLDSKKVPHLLCPCGVDIGLGRARLPLLKQLLAMLGLWEWRDTPDLSMVTILVSITMELRQTITKNSLYRRNVKNWHLFIFPSHKNLKPCFDYIIVCRSV